jgi:hypothetical protein
MKKLSNTEIMQLVKDHIEYSNNGYVTWKGKQFEHFTDPDDCINDIDLMRSYVERIQHLEANGIPINSNTVVWSWEKFSTLTKEDEYFDLLSIVGDIWRKGKNHFVFTVKDRDYNTVVIENGKIATKMDSDFSDRGQYHYYKDLGYSYLNIGQGKDMGLCYATTKKYKAFLKKNNIPVTL